MCHRNLGIGADGVLLIENSSCADYKMRVFNADGSEAEMCGNGLRCVVHYLSLPREVLIETKHSTYKCKKISENSVSVEIPRPIIDSEFINTGVPHKVVVVSDLENIDPPTDKKHNVNFACISPDKICIRTFERGVGETLACGTGAAAVALYAFEKHQVQNPIQITVRSQDLLQFYIRENTIEMIGPAQKVFEGDLLFSF